MKVFASIIAFASVVVLVQSALDPEIEKHFLSVVDVCRENTEPPNLNNIGNPGLFLLNNIRKGIRENKCLLSCVMQGVSLLDSSGKLIKGTGMAIAMGITNNEPDQMKIAEDIMNSCAGISVSDDVCDAAVQYAYCLKKANDSKGVNVDIFEFILKLA